MSYTELFVTNAGAGAANGSNLANAMSWASMLTDATAGSVRYLVSGAITRTTNADTFTTAGTAAAPRSLRGINASSGDLEANGRTRGGGLVTTNFPVITYTTGGVTFPIGFVVETASFTSAKVGATVTLGSSNVVRRCTIANTHASSASALAITGNQTSILDDCDLANSSSDTTTAAYTGAGGIIVRCLITGNTSGCGCAISTGNEMTLISCVLRDAGYGITSAGRTMVQLCAFRNITNIYASLTGGNYCRMVNNVAWGVGGSSKFYSSSASVRMGYMSANAVGNMGASDTNVGDWPTLSSIALSADPFTSSTDLTLNNAATGGALCRATGLPSYLDLGAWQGPTAAPVIVSSGF